MKDIRRLRSVRFLQVWPPPRRLFAISTPSEWRSIGIDIPGRLGNGGEAKAELEYSEEI
jgi:hypothetical protein